LAEIGWRIGDRILWHAPSKARHWVFWQALSAAGVLMVASWIDQPFNHADEEPADEAWSQHWDQQSDWGALAVVNGAHRRTILPLPKRCLSRGAITSWM
jgi:hypothetical protein